MNRLIKKAQVISPFFKALSLAVVYVIFVNGIDTLIAYILVETNNTNYYNSIYGYIIYLPLLMILLLLTRDKTYGYKKFNPYFLLYALFLTFFFRIFEDPFLRIKNIIGTIPFPDNIENTTVLKEDIHIAIFTIVLIPLVEELFFRKYLTSILSQKGVKEIYIILFTSVLFALIHFTFPNIFLSFFFGIILSIIYIQTHNIFYPIVVHSSYNLLWYILSIYRNKYWSLIKGLNFNFLYWIIFISSILIVFLLLIFILKKFKK